MEPIPDHSRLAGELCGMMLLVIPAVYFLIRGFLAGAGSLRLANLALFCGLILLMPPSAVGSESPESRGAWFRSLGILSFALGFTGLGLAIAALVKQPDGQIGIARPVVGMVLCLLQLLCGVGHLWFGSYSNPGQPWVYRSPDKGFALTLPSKRWRQYQERRELVKFACLVPRMVAGVLTVQTQQTEADFDKAVEAFRVRVQSNASREFRTGTNAAGNIFHYWWGTEKDADGQSLLVASSLTWCPQKQMFVEVMFEGQSAMRSRDGRTVEWDAMQRAAESICLSVE